MNSDRDATGQARGGLPHSETPGSPIARISPGFFAACHVLHRLSVPRHPPDALTSRLITGLSPQEETASPPRTGPNPALAVSHEDTSRTHSQQALLARTCPPRSHHKRSLHPSINHRRGHPRRLLVLVLPRTPHRPLWARRWGPADGASRRSSAAPVGRQSLASPVVEVNGFEPMTSCLQSRRSPS